MKTKAYNSFNDIYGNHYSFDNWKDFSKWWHSASWSQRNNSFDAATFKRLEFAVSRSKEARTIPFAHLAA